MMQDDTNKTMAPNFREIMPTFNEVYACGDWEEGDKLSAGWITAIVAIVFAAILLTCFIYKTFKVQALQQEIIDVANANRSRQLNEQCKADQDNDAVNGVQGKGTMEMGDMQKV